MKVVNYPVGDFLIRIKNAALAGKREIDVSETKLIKAVADVLKKEGYLEKVTEKQGKLNIRLAFRRKEPVLFKLKLVSKPGWPSGITPPHPTRRHATRGSFPDAESRRNDSPRRRPRCERESFSRDDNNIADSTWGPARSDRRQS